jgi:hypothetical protein
MNIPGTFGLVTVEKWVDYQRNGIELKTIYNGHDITHRCMPQMIERMGSHLTQTRRTPLHRPRPQHGCQSPARGVC